MAYSSPKNAKVRQIGVWWIANGTGTRSDIECCIQNESRSAEEPITRMEGDERLAIVTSSPRTETSGLRKWRRAVMAAIDAQSSRFPSSSRK